MLRIGDLTFEVDRQRSELLGFVPQEAPGVASPGRLHWSLEVYCVDQENALGVVAPCLYASDVALDVPDWRLLNSVVLQDGGEPPLVAYLRDVFVDKRTTDNVLRFASRSGT